MSDDNHAFPKFVQILSAGFDQQFPGAMRLVALDAIGDLWVFEPNGMYGDATLQRSYPPVWKKLPTAARVATDGSRIESPKLEYHPAPRV